MYIKWPKINKAESSICFIFTSKLKLGLGYYNSGLLHPWEAEGNARLRNLRWIKVWIFGSYLKSPNSWDNMCPKRNLKAIPKWFWKLQHLLVDWFRSFHLSYLSVWRKVGNGGHIGKKGLSMCFHQLRSFLKSPTVNSFFQKFYTVFF